MAFGRFRTKSLCEFPFGKGGFFNLKYEQLNYHPDYPSGSKPNGGISISIFVGSFDTEEDLNAFVKKIYWVKFTNKDNGQKYLLKKPSIAYWDSQAVDLRPGADYKIFLGHENMLIGNWEAVVLTKFGRFIGTFSITEEMMEQIPPEAVNPWIDSITDEEFTIKFYTTNGDDYRIRMSADDGSCCVEPEIRWDMMYWCNSQEIPPECCHNPSSCDVELSATLPRKGDFLRVYTHLFGTEWLYMFPGHGCNSNGMESGGASRALIYVDIP